jgi:predicted RNA-binding Zn-ribbon protein involved in translation (DUF1610 family)
MPDWFGCWNCHGPLEPGKPGEEQVCPTCGHVNVYQPEAAESANRSRASSSARANTLSVAAFAGGFVGMVGLGLAGVLLGAGSAGGMLTEPSSGLHVLLSGTVGAVVGLPLGIAMGLHIARTRLEKRGPGNQLPTKRANDSGPHP